LYLCSCVMRKAIRFRLTSRATMVPATLNHDHLALRRLQPLMPSPGRLRVSIGSCPESPSHSCYANFTSIPVRLRPQISHWGMNLHASATSWPISRPRRLQPLFCKRARCSRTASPALASHSFCGSVPSPIVLRRVCRARVHTPLPEHVALSRTILSTRSSGMIQRHRQDGLQLIAPSTVEPARIHL
jgi:hypothetical protein